MKNENKKFTDIRRNGPMRPNLPSSSTTQKPASMISRGISSSINLVKKPIRNMDIAKSNIINHFAPKNSTNQKPLQNQAAKIPDLKATTHPIVQKIQDKPVQPVIDDSKTIKETAIAEAFQTIAERQAKEKEQRKKHHKKIRNFCIIIGLLLIISLFAVIFLPNISLGLVNSKTGVSATIPSYCPEGYNRKPIAYSVGKDVVIDFVSKSGNFQLKQSKSSWDSSAVKDMVEESSEGEYKTTEESGLTIFSYNGNAAWVNGGILYTISGNTSLDISEIRKIVLSL